MFRLGNPDTGEFWLIAAHDLQEASCIANSCGWNATKIREFAYFYGRKTNTGCLIEDEGDFYPERNPF
jgi:hypothetical protein